MGKRLSPTENIKKAKSIKNAFEKYIFSKKVTQCRKTGDEMVSNVILDLYQVLPQGNTYI